MEIITQPMVHLLCEPTFIPHPKYVIPEGGTPAEQLIAMAGKGCYDSYGIDGRPLRDHIRTLIDSNHGSVLEHANVSIFVSGISRGVSHEWVRHRAGFGYSQRSTRYTNEGECAITLEPYLAEIYNNPDGATEEEKEDVYQFIASCRRSVHMYGAMVTRLLSRADTRYPEANAVTKRKWARGKARNLLPIAIETRMTVTGNLRAWRHFFFMRSSRGAEAEIRRVCADVFGVVQPLAPIVFEDFDIGMYEGIPEYTTPLPKV